MISLKKAPILIFIMMTQDLIIWVPNISIGVKTTQQLTYHHQLIYKFYH